MERDFITGRGLVTPLGNSLEVNEAALRSGASGLSQVPEFLEHRLESVVGGVAGEGLTTPLIDRKLLRFAPPTAVMSVVAATEAFAEAEIPLESLRERKIAIIGGTAGSNYREVFQNVDDYIRSDYRLRRVSPYCVPRVMPSSAISNLSLIFGITGESYDISAACASSALSILMAVRLIRAGIYDMVLAGGAEQIDWVQALGFCACRALSRKYNDTPELASRPFDRDRDGFVLASGAAYVLLESERSLKARGVRPISQVSGIAANSNAHDMVVPDAAASAAVIREAIADAGLKPADIGYVNTHGTGTPVGDPLELAAIREVIGSGAASTARNRRPGTWSAPPERRR